jgi:anaerobic magnesium-protoporphyrin IX monomethyl ester cyclase
VNRPSAAHLVSPHCLADPGPDPIDLLIGHSLFMQLDPKQVARQTPFPPLGTLYAASSLREAGYRVAVFDSMLAPDEQAFEAALEACRPALVILCEDSFNFLSKMCLARMREAALTMLGMAASRGLPVLVSGSDASDQPAAYLDAGATAVAIGEPEQSLLAATGIILPRAGAGRSPWLPAAGRPSQAALDGLVAALAELPGLALRMAGRLHTAARRPVETSPDRLPLPARDLVDMHAYRGLWQAAHGRFILNLAASRGCPFHCNWCARPIWGQRHAAREAERVADELQMLDRVFRPDALWFVDDLFGLKPGWLDAFASALAQRGLRIPFKIQSRVDLIDAGAAEALARAGCEEVWLGVESGSQKVLDAMEKGIRVEAVPNATRLLQAQGIRACFFLQLGYPGETWADIEATAALVRDCRPDAIGVSVSYPLPGTGFYARVSAELGERRHWRDSQDLAMLFRGRYQTAFYRRLHAALHAELDARQRLGRARDRGEAAAIRIAEHELAGAMRRWAELAEDEVSNRNAAPTSLLELPASQEVLAASEAIPSVSPKAANRGFR